MIYALDRGVGRVLDWLQKESRISITLIVFFSDNGGATSNGSWNGDFAEAKGTLLEGGVRVPMIWSWPGKIPAGKRHDSPVYSLDLLPTFLAAAEDRPLPLAPASRHEDADNCRRASKLYRDYDGINVLPLFSATAKGPERTLFWRLQGQRAVLHGEDKLIALSDRPPQLFQPKDDSGERRDLAAREPAKMQDLFKRLGEWEASLETAPLWDESPRWWADSARIYDTWAPQDEPR